MEFDPFAPVVCAGCKKQVYASEKVTALKQVWHKGCLKCATCGLTLTTNSLESYQNTPYCKAHKPNPKHTAVKSVTDQVASNVPKAARRVQGINKSSRMTFAPGAQGAIKADVRPGQTAGAASRGGSVAAARSKFSGAPAAAAATAAAPAAAYDDGGYENAPAEAYYDGAAEGYYEGEAEGYYEGEGEGYYEGEGEGEAYYEGEGEAYYEGEGEAEAYDEGYGY